jgi:signal peptidase I
MMKRKSPTAKPHSETDAPATKGAARHMPTPEAIRETIESIVIAFALAFLFRTFEAEAFVIPTGSMAPTLMGRHKDLVCPKCGCPYQVGSSEEVDKDNGQPKIDSYGRALQVVAGTCPMCRYTAYLGPDNPQRERYPSYNGDRILVGKFAYEVDDPQRWDVIVFKYPCDAPTNFIKRLVGLPGETIRIQNGDLWIRRGEKPFEIARKPPTKLLAMLQTVFDNDYMPKIAQYGWPARWQAESPADGAPAGAWTSDDQTTFRTDGAATGQRWLRYHHRLPSYMQWTTQDRQKTFSQQDVAPQYILDFTAYNTYQIRSDGNFEPSPESLGRYWVGDLALRCTLDVEADCGALLFELRKGGRRFQCRLDVATGQASLSIGGKDMEAFRPKAATVVRGAGRHKIRFSNCDNELLLWIDGDVVKFDAPTTYDDLANTSADPSDLEPVGVATHGAKAKISHLAIFRDIYYTPKQPASDRQHFASDDSRLMGAERNRGAKTYHPADNFAEFTLKADQFFALGDNSAASSDGRYWGPVARDLLLGEALLIYWPHSWDKIPYVDIPFYFFPNFRRMGLVR